MKVVLRDALWRSHGMMIRLCEINEIAGIEIFFLLFIIFRYGCAFPTKIDSWILTQEVVTYCQKFIIRWKTIHNLQTIIFIFRAYGLYFPIFMPPVSSMIMSLFSFPVVSLTVGVVLVFHLLLYELINLILGILKSTKFIIFDSLYLRLLKMLNLQYNYIWYIFVALSFDKIH